MKMNAEDLQSLLQLQNKSQHLLRSLVQGQAQCRNAASGMVTTHLKQTSAGSSHTSQRKASTASSDYGITVYRQDPAGALRRKIDSCRHVQVDTAQHTPKRWDYSAVEDLEGQAGNRSQASDVMNSTTLSECGQQPADLSTPVKSYTIGKEVSNSTLRRRKIIDDNVKVESNERRPEGSVLADYSYDFDDLRANIEHAPDLDPEAGTPCPDTPSRDRSVLDHPSKERSRSGARVTDNQLQIDMHEGPEVYRPGAVPEQLLLDSGNKRRTVRKVPTLHPMDVGVGLSSVGREREIANGDIELQTKSGEQRLRETRPKTGIDPEMNRSGPVNAGSRLWQTRRDDPLLGYDWIAGVLENESSIMHRPADYFDEIKDFRRKYRDDCVTTDSVGRRILDLTRPISPEVQDPGHTCIHGYTLNERLFTEPMNVNEDGLSVCPVCLIPRKDPTPVSPGFVRVSIPRSTLEAPYKVRPHTRKSFDPVDSFALSKHCLAGWECTVPSSLPTAKNLDLRQAADGLKAKQTTTMQDAERAAGSYSRTSRVYGIMGSAIPAPGVADSTTSVGDRTLAEALLNITQPPTAGRADTQALLNTTHSLRYDLQRLEQERGLDRRRIPHSTRYPML